jgi:hypothetical protein
VVYELLHPLTGDAKHELDLSRTHQASHESHLRGNRP